MVPVEMCSAAGRVPVETRSVAGSVPVETRKEVGRVPVEMRERGSVEDLIGDEGVRGDRGEGSLKNGAAGDRFSVVKWKVDGFPRDGFSGVGFSFIGFAFVGLSSIDLPFIFSSIDLPFILSSNDLTPNFSPIDLTPIILSSIDLSTPFPSTDLHKPSSPNDTCFVPPIRVSSASTLRESSNTSGTTSPICSINSHCRSMIACWRRISSISDTICRTSSIDPLRLWIVDSNVVMRER